MGRDFQGGHYIAAAPSVYPTTLVAPELQGAYFADLDAISPNPLFGQANGGVYGVLSDMFEIKTESELSDFTSSSPSSATSSYCEEEYFEAVYPSTSQIIKPTMETTWSYPTEFLYQGIHPGIIVTEQLIMTPPQVVPINNNNTLIDDPSPLFYTKVEAASTSGPTPHFECAHPGCKRVFKHYSSWQQHSKRHGISEPTHVCPHVNCGKLFIDRKALSDHRRTHNTDRPFTCTSEGCAATFKKRTHLIEHMRIHSKDRPFACEYPGCSKHYRHRCSLMAHMKLVHDKLDE